MNPIERLEEALDTLTGDDLEKFLDELVQYFQYRSNKLMADLDLVPK